MKLIDMPEKLNRELDEFPYRFVSSEHMLTDHVYICLSLIPKGKWPFGYIENSRFIKAMIFCSDSREVENDRYRLEIICNNTGVKLRQASNKTAEQILNHTIKELKKLVQVIEY